MSKSRILTKAAQAAVVTLTIPLVAQFEGLRTKAYLDTGGVPTICYGETSNVKLGDEIPKDQCKKLLTARLGYFSMQVTSLTTISLPPETHAAITSFTYNVGVNAFKTSTLRRLLNSGDIQGACNQLTRWTYDNKVYVQGLMNRRIAERALCLEGLKRYNGA